MKTSKYFLLAVAFGLPACSGDKGAATNASGNSTGNAAAAAPQKAAIAGDWTATAPVVTDEDDMTASISNLRYTYFSDNKLSFSGQLSLSGGELPDTMNFKIAGDGSYIEEGQVLRQDIEKLSLTPSSDGATEEAIANELEKLLRREPSSIHDVLELSDKKLRLRDRSTGKILELTRGA